MACALVCLGMATTAFAQNTDVIKQRKEAFKSLIPHVKAGTAMMKGQAAFDLAKAKEIFSSYATIAKPLPDLFPEDSRTGEETRALPVIWEKKDDFNQRLVKFVNDATEASGSIDSEAAFKAAWPTVMGNCGACHKVYRAEKK